jgi:hypothetical protein
MKESRTLRIEPVPASVLVCVAWNGGGELPQALKGSFTSAAIAQMAINAYLSKVEREPIVAEVVEEPRRGPGRPRKAESL